MRYLKDIFLVTFYLLLSVFGSFAQSVGINATGTTPDASALLDLSSIDKGFLITRADTGNIATPAFGLMTLSPIDSCLYLYNGINWKGMGGGGSNCSCNCSESSDPTPTFPCDGTVIPIVDVTNPVTGHTWMDRNLGASQVATSTADEASYGDLYQWGRCSDGHEKRTSSTTNTLSSTDDPGHGDFILRSAAPSDWRSSQNDNLWQGTGGINNPCPTGYRLPTEVELEAERASWSSSNSVGAIGSPLKFPVASFRSHSNGVVYTGANPHGYLWSSTVNGDRARSLYYHNTSSSIGDGRRAQAFSVRCFKD